MARTDATNPQFTAAPEALAPSLDLRADSVADPTKPSAPTAGFQTGPTTVAPGDTSESQVSELAEQPRRIDSASRLGVLRHKHFRNIWIAAFGSSVGGWMEIIGMQWVLASTTLEKDWVAAHNPGAPIMAGYLAVAQMGPTLVFGLLGGVVADRVNRKNLLLITQFMLMLVAAALCGATYMHKLTPWLLILLGGINGTIMAFNIPAWQVLTPRLVPREELTAAVTLNGIQFNLARVIGPAAGGILMQQYGAGALFAVNTISFLGILIAIFTTPPAPAPPRDGSNAWEQSKEAFVYAFTRKGPLVLIAIISLFSMLGTPLLRMLPILVHEVYHAKEDIYGRMMAALGVGAVAGGLLMRYIPRWYPKHHLIPLSITAAGIGITVLVACEDWHIAQYVMAFVGVFWLLSFNPAFAALQMLVEDRIRGRVMAICNMISFGAMPVGSLLAGGISSVVSGSGDNGFGTQVGVGVLSLVLTVIGLVMLCWRTPEIDGLKPGDPGYDKRPGLLHGVLAHAHRPLPGQVVASRSESPAGPPPSAH